MKNKDLQGKLTIKFPKNLISTIFMNKKFHGRDSHWYQSYSEKLQQLMIQNHEYEDVELGEIGRIKFPYREMGAITSSDLLGLDELIIFSFYYSRYDKSLPCRMLDLGANIGLHSVVANKIGYEVTAVEPDPIHLEILEKNLEQNGATDVTLVRGAVAKSEGSAKFVRVEGNTTGSHIEGASGKNPYGAITKFTVTTYGINKLLSAGFNFVKMDVEGLEFEVLSAIETHFYANIEFILEIGSAENALAIFNYLQENGLRSYSQKSGWRENMTSRDFPTSYKEGSILISQLETFPF